jgi:hypothetical protein
MRFGHLRDGVWGRSIQIIRFDEEGLPSRRHQDTELNEHAMRIVVVD